MLVPLGSGIDRDGGMIYFPTPSGVGFLSMPLGISLEGGESRVCRIFSEITQESHNLHLSSKEKAW